jgi:hypothetical protein
MKKHIFIFIALIFAVSCTPTAKKQWVSTIAVKSGETPVSKDFLKRVKTNWYYNKTTKCYGVNKGFNGYFKYKEKGFDEVMKLTTSQFFDIFGQPDFWRDSSFNYAHIDFKLRIDNGWSPYLSTPMIYSVLVRNQKIHFGGNDEDRTGYYDKKYGFKQLIDSAYKASNNCCKTEEDILNYRNAKAKKVMADYFFYCKQAGHYVLIDYAPFPSSCDSRTEVIKVFGKPSKVDPNGDLIYYLSLPNRYGNRNLMKCSPLSNGKYAIDIVIHD